MPDSILVTKLFIPPSRPEFVSRPRLIGKLNEGLRSARKMSLISAPAGFGKTTLVSEWVNMIQLDDATEGLIECRMAWLSLDEDDNDATRFLNYMVAALNQATRMEKSLGEGVLRMLQSPQPPPLQAVLISLINELAAISGRVILVLDDYHLIGALPIHEALTFLLEHLPHQVHLVLVTREDPLIPLSRLRARGQLTELRAADLRFTSPEATEFLNKTMRLSLSEEDIAALENRTEGWIAGLHLAAISMQGIKDTASLIKSFTGSHRLVLDYLIEEVLNLQTESVQNFLLETAILDKMTGSLCDQLTGKENGQATLELLEHANLFLIPLDEERRWYRYHHLFVDLLREKLRQTRPEAQLTLHRRASDWYRQNHFFAEAVEHALFAEDFEHAAGMIEEQADAMFQRGEQARLRRWLAGLPIDILRSRPKLCIFHAWYLFASGDHEAAELTLRAAEQVLESSTDSTAETALQERNTLTSSGKVRQQGRAAAIRALMDSYQGDVPGMIQHARQALEYLPEQDATWRSTAAIVLGDAHGFKNELAAAYEARLEALKACKAAGNTYFIIYTSMKLAITLWAKGALQQVIAICQQQFQLVNDCGLSQTALAGWLLSIWGAVLAEINELDDGLERMKKGMELTERGGDVVLLGWNYVNLIRVFISRGKLSDAEEAIQKIERLAQEFDVPAWITDEIAGWQTRLWLVQGKLELATQWARGRRLDLIGEPKPVEEIDFSLLYDYLALARIQIAQDLLDEASRLLQRMLEAAEAGEYHIRLLEIAMLQALVLQAQGHTDQAVARLEQALTLAEPGGFVSIFVGEGPPMAHLLYEALTRGIAEDYVRRLLAAFPDVAPEQTGQKRTGPDQSELIEPLSEREIEVLQLLAEGLSNSGIASRLYLSLNTIKVHTRNINGKLGVNNRTQAVARARTLGILP